MWERLTLIPLLVYTSAIFTYFLIPISVQTTCSWSLTLLLICQHIATKRTHRGIWENVRCSVLFFQTLQGLEVLHVAMGLVNSNLFNTFHQILSRYFSVWGILYQTEEITNNSSITVMLISWSIAEITRYALYSTTLLGKTPAFLSWCRYNFFLVLYPTGISAEFVTAVSALPYISTKQPFAVTLPNAANVSFDYYYFCVFILLTGVPGFPNIFWYMLNRRRKYNQLQKQKAA